MYCYSLKKYTKTNFDTDSEESSGSKPYYTEHPTVIIAKILKTRYAITDKTHKEVYKINTESDEEFKKLEKSLVGIKSWDKVKNALYANSYVIEFAPVEGKNDEYALFAIRPCDVNGKYQAKGNFIDELQLICVIIKNLSKKDAEILKGNDSDDKFIISDTPKALVNKDTPEQKQSSSTESILKPQNKEELREALVATQAQVGWTGDYNSIDTSAITDMSNLFENLQAENGESFEENFNGDISKWDVSNVTNMAYMFANMTAFDGDLSQWNVSNVENMQGMFYGATNFNNGGKKIDWNTINVYDMRYMFAYATKFQQSINKWDLQETVETHGMFAGKGPDVPAGAYRGKLPNYLKDKNIFTDLFEE